MTNLDRVSKAEPSRCRQRSAQSKLGFFLTKYGCEIWTIRRLSARELMLLNCGAGIDSWESPRQQGNQISQSEKKSILNIHWKDWYWSWSFNTLATCCKEPTHCKRPWCWERLRAGGERDYRGWDDWMKSPTERTWVWVDSRSSWWTGSPGRVLVMGSQRVGHDWATDWTELNWMQMRGFLSDLDGKLKETEVMSLEFNQSAIVRKQK